MIELWNSLQFKAMQCSSTNQYKCTKRPHPRCVNPGVVVFSTSFAYFLLHHHISVELNCGLDTYQAMKEVILIIAYFRIADWKKCFIQLNFALKDIAKQSWLTQMMVDQYWSIKDKPRLKTSVISQFSFSHSIVVKSLSSRASNLNYNFPPTKIFQSQFGAVDRQTCQLVLSKSTIFSIFFSPLNPCQSLQIGCS